MGKHNIGPVGRPTGYLSASFQTNARLMGRLGSGRRLMSRLGSEIRVSANFQKNANLVGWF